MSPFEILSKFSSILENPQENPQLDYSQCCDLTKCGIKMIDSFAYPITGVLLQPTVQQVYRSISAK